MAGAITARRAKHELPNYGVFDDKRVFDAGPCTRPGGVSRLSAWACSSARIGGSRAVAETLAETGAEMLLSINGSARSKTAKSGKRVQLGVDARGGNRFRRSCSCAQVCGQDELVFDGASFVLNP